MKLQRIVTALSAALMFITSAVAEQSHTVTITGYPVNEYKVTGAIEQQFEEHVVGPIVSALPRAKGTERLSIQVIGFADKTGRPDLNQDIGQKRADQIRELLLWKFPNALVTATTKGDDENVRMVSVTWKIVPAPAAPKDQEPKLVSTPMAILAATALFAALIASAWLVLLSRKRPTSSVVSVALAAAPAPVTTESDVAEKRYERDGKTYVVTFRKVNGMWETPFRNQNNRTTFNRREKLADAYKVADLFMGKLFDKPDTQDMIRNGTIREVQ